MDFIFCLAHYCEIHGPQSILCTRAFPESLTNASGRSVSVSPPSSDSSQDPIPSLKQSTSSLRTAAQATAGAAPIQSSATTPRPASPHAHTASSPSDEPKADPSPSSLHDPGSLRQSIATPRQQSGIAGLGAARRSEGHACASCSFTIPQYLQNKLPKGAPGSADDESSRANDSPVLRTRSKTPYYDSSSDRDDDDSSASDDPSTRPGQQQRRQSRPTPRNAGTTPQPIPHRGHPPPRRPSPRQTLTYITTRHPSNPSAYTTLRHAIIRALSLETLPRGCSSGPLVFASPDTGHTVAFIFRLPDLSARGHRRTYALLAVFDPRVGDHAPRSDTRGPPGPSGPTISHLTNSFAGLAASLTLSAETTHHKAREAPPPPQPTRPSASRDRVTPPSSFLIDPAGRGDGGGKVPPSAKSVADVVGRDGVGVEVHVAFVGLAAGLVGGGV